jgi:DNA-binding MarR family transcriptional regulator
MRASSEALTDLVLEVFRLNGALLASGDALVADVGLTSARWQVLGAIALSPLPLPVAHIARNMGLSRQAVQRLTNEMERDGLVRFGPNPHHQRAKLVHLTRQGRAAYDAAIERWDPWAAALAKAQSAKEIDKASALLRTIRQRVEEDRGGQNAGGNDDA